TLPGCPGPGRAVPRGRTAPRWRRGPPWTTTGTRRSRPARPRRSPRYAPPTPTPAGQRSPAAGGTSDRRTETASPAATPPPPNPRRPTHQPGPRGPPRGGAGRRRLALGGAAADREPVGVLRPGRVVPMQHQQPAVRVEDQYPGCPPFDQRRLTAGVRGRYVVE